MSKLNRIAGVLLWMLCGHSVISQSYPVNIPSSQADSTLVIFKLNDLLSLVMTNHPVMKQSELQSDYAKAELRMAKGMLDPKVYSSLDLKNYDGKEYYDLRNATLSIPTWFPFDPKVSIDRNRGLFINPESSLPAGNNFRQVNAGLSMPLGRGLFIDERRTAIQQAKAFQDIAAAEQIKIANKILLTAIKDYWEWYYGYQQLQLLKQSADIAQEIFERVLMDYEFGEASVLDTLQAKITYQTRMADFESAKLDYYRAGLSLSVHIWSEKLEPLELKPNVIPYSLENFWMMPDMSTLETLLDWAGNFHPEIAKLEGKLEQLEAERKWNVENLKPVIDLSYTLIDAPIDPTGEIVNPTFRDNYKLGMDFYVPLFLRKERGKLQLTKVKIEEGSLELANIRLTIKNAIYARYQETITASILTEQFLQMAETYQKLLEAEILNLEFGESELFKLNIQQDKYIESQMKYFKNVANFQKSKAELLYESGVPYLFLK